MSDQNGKKTASVPVGEMAIHDNNNEVTITKWVSEICVLFITFTICEEEGLPNLTDISRVIDRTGEFHEPEVIPCCNICIPLQQHT